MFLPLQIIPYSIILYYFTTFFSNNYNSLNMPIPTNSKSNQVKITVIGAAGGIGQSLSLLLRTSLQNNNDNQLHLALFDVNMKVLNGVHADLSHVNTNMKLSLHDNLRDSLVDSNLVIIPAGVPRKPGMTRDDLFNINAGIIKGIAQELNTIDSTPFVLLISNPVNSLLPVLQSVLNDVYLGRCFGITELDLVRASTFVNGFMDNSASSSNEMPYVPVIGGHSGDTILPVLSNCSFNNSTFSAYDLISDDVAIKKLVHRIQYGGDEVVQAKDGMGSATLSMAYSAFLVAKKFVQLLTNQVSSIDGIFYIPLTTKDWNSPLVDNAQSVLPLVQNVPFFSIKCTVNSKGISQIDPTLVQNLNNYERESLLPTALNQLQANIDTGLTFASK
ncbi:hypothetical protein Kpol_1076p4 [Vanderwaltozyma polyspora DSM 70294]|uniref:malate dehydrogenase n=1 Tax=Vanderwaltozyma polyspora (strain ATCC 22028 / DSM 70294 / BCRC 21397 / CBS 2163 / NBRC 10782 / NRRL Y-8283 / UCD 57-17) TaxID=436907 RepID=A7TSF5_VANPO|nr:uncharacterized protein Kpol_1076p4 [Vanderwaltozyma polyspora DSM 70294]EDO14798.1 hypothetical protein Kpol_1076p4 [Vanderwaltozyma polyspora DSM 70294]